MPPSCLIRIALSSVEALAAVNDTLVLLISGAEVLTPLTAEVVTIGADAVCQIRLSEPEFAALSLAVETRSGGYYLCDRRKAHALVARGTHLNEAVLGPDEPVYAPGSLGRALSFRVRPIARGEALAGRRAAGQAVSMRFRPDQQTLSIGRDARNDVVLDSPVVSRFHAQVDVWPTMYFCMICGA